MYHEVKDQHGHPLPGHSSIACQQCAKAKTACDKAVPSCSRCLERSISCSPRHARRQSKAAVRRDAIMGCSQRLATQPYDGLSQQYTLPLITENKIAASRDFPPKPGQCSASAVGSFDSSTGVGTYTVSPVQVSPFDDSPCPQNDIYYYGPIGLHSSSNSYANFLVQPECTMNVGVVGGTFLDSLENEAVKFNDDPFIGPSSQFMAFEAPIEAQMVTVDDLASSPKLPEGETQGNWPMTTPDPQISCYLEDEWPIIKCNTRAIFSVPVRSRTGSTYMERLEQGLKQTSWASIDTHIGQATNNRLNTLSVAPLPEEIHHHLTETVRSYIRGIIETRRRRIGNQKIPAPKGISLPPVEILSFFLRLFASKDSKYYFLLADGQIFLRDLVSPQNRSSSLLALLMIAQGASVVPMPQAQHLSLSLVEACRNELSEITLLSLDCTRDIKLLHCALLFVMIGAWSDVKRTMNEAVVVRDTYMRRLEQEGLFGRLPSSMLVPQTSLMPRGEWRLWAECEYHKRLVYDWVRVDQELCLFYGIRPFVLIKELECQLPGPDEIWNSDHFLRMKHRSSFDVDKPSPLSLPWAPSLCDLFLDLQRGQLVEKHPNMRSEELRLLLYPIQALIYHHREVPLDNLGHSVLTHGPIFSQVDEARALMHKWYEASQSYNQNRNGDAIIVNQVLYHLVSLNVIAHFHAIEAFARQEKTKGQNCIDDHGEAKLHCRQTFKLLSSMSHNLRPCWWAVAVYRVTLILWASKLMKPDFPDEEQQQQSQSRETIMIAGSNSSFQPQMSYSGVQPDLGASEGPGWPSVGLGRDMKSQERLLAVPKKPAKILQFGIELIKEGAAIGLGDGIVRKLEKLGERWSKASDEAGSKPGSY